MRTFILAMPLRALTAIFAHTFDLRMTSAVSTVVEARLPEAQEIYDRLSKKYDWKEAGTRKSRRS
jgi:hypothetical protein